MRQILPAFRQFAGWRLRAASVLLLAGIVAFSWTQRSSAANPSSGTLSIANPVLNYNAGPFLTSNPTAQTGTLMCDAQFPCDDYALTVNVPAGTDATKNIRVTTTYMTPPDTDYDTYILQSGVEVASAASSSNPEVALFPAVPGSYTVRNVPFAVGGGSITVKVELIDKPVNPPTPPAAGIPPRYEVYQSPAALGNSAGEPTLGVGKAVPGHPEGRTMFVAGTQTLRVTFDDCSSPAGALWENVSAPNTSQVTFDPILQTDAVTGRTFVSQLLPNKTSLASFTDNDGGTNGQAVGDWTVSQGSGINSGVDHQTVGTGPFRPGLPDGIGAYTQAFYYASQDIAVAQLAISRDGGLTYGNAFPMYNLTQCGGLHGHIQVAPVGSASVGTVYVPNKSCGGKQGMAVSADEGMTFEVTTAPLSTPGKTDPAAGVDAGGLVYFGYSNGDGTARAAVYDPTAPAASRWSKDQDVGAQLGIKNAVFGTVVGGSAGRAAYAFIGSTTGGDGGNTAFTGEWHLYVAHTYDSGATWQLVNATPNDPVQRGSICTSGTTCGADRNLLDFMDITVDREGRAQVGFADGCLGCTAPANSRADKATIARQSSGRRLFAQFDTPEPTVPKAPKVNGATQDALGVVTVSWQVPDNGGSALTGYKVSRKTGLAGTYAVIGNVAANRTTFVDTTSVNGMQYYYKVTATNLIGEGLNCGEFLVGVAGAIESACVAPGLTVITDPAGDNTTAAAGAQRDIRQLSISEIYDPAVSNNVIYARMKINAAFNATTGPPPSSRWTFFFKRTIAAVTTEWFLSMVTDDTAAPGTPVFRYGHVTLGTGGVRTLNTDGTATGTFSGDTINFSTRNLVRTNMGATGLTFPPLTTGEVLADITATTQQSGGALLLNDDSATATAVYTIVSNNFCRPNIAPIANLTGTPGSGNAPLAVTFSGAGSSDPDTAAPADTIASYTIDFGDGSTAGPQASPTFTHTYTMSGTFSAKLTVTDSRGKASTNLAQAFTTVQQSGPRLASLELGTTNNGTAQTLVGGCKPDKGKVTLTQAAPTGGFVVTLSDDLNAASVPATVTVPAGQTFVEFFTTTMQVSAAELGAVSAQAGSDRFSQSLTVRPVRVRSIGLSPSNVVTGAQTVTGTATLECPMVNPLVVALESSVPSVATVGSSSLNFAANQISNTFTISTIAQTGKPRATIINATAPGATTVGAKLTVNNQ